MSKKIVVAGAGHGGVIAAAKLAKEGFEVTVYEKKNAKTSVTTGKTALISRQFWTPSKRTRCPTARGNIAETPCS